MGINDEFTRFEHEGWERVAAKYDSVWSSLTAQFIPYLIDAAQVQPAMSILDVACGPGYVSAGAQKLGANPTGIDFSKRMVEIARTMFPGINFIEADAQQLPFADANFDRVLMNFGLLHLAQPEKACAEALRVLRPGGKFAFTVWAEPPQNPGGKIVNAAIEAHADLNVQLPTGPPYHLFSDKNECRKVLQQVGFDAASMIFRDTLGRMEYSNIAVSLRSRARCRSPHCGIAGAPNIGPARRDKASHCRGREALCEGRWFCHPDGGACHCRHKRRQAHLSERASLLSRAVWFLFDRSWERCV